MIRILEKGGRELASFYFEPDNGYIECEDKCTDNYIRQRAHSIIFESSRDMSIIPVLMQAYDEDIPTSRKYLRGLSSKEKDTMVRCILDYYREQQGAAKKEPNKPDLYPLLSQLTDMQATVLLISFAEDVTRQKEIFTELAEKVKEFDLCVSKHLDRY